MTLEEYKRLNNLTLQDLSIDLGISISLLSKIINHKCNISKRVLDILNKHQIEYNSDMTYSVKWYDLIRENTELKKELKALKKQFIIVNDNLQALKRIIETSNDLINKINLKSLKLTHKTYYYNKDRKVLVNK